MTTLPTNLANKPDKLAPSVVAPTDILHVFKSSMRYMNFVFSNGMIAEFINHVYYTKREDQIAELNREIAFGHPQIHVDPNALTIVAEDRDPVVSLRKKIRDELIADGWAKINPDNDMGKSEQGKLTPASTTSIAAVSANGDGTAGHKLAVLAAELASKAK